MKKLLSIFIILITPTNVFAYTLNDTDKIIVDRVVQKIGKISTLSQDKILLQLEKAYGKAWEWRTKTLVESVLRRYVSNGTYRVLEVVDGDTIKVDFHWRETSIRILGIDTPEKYATRTGSEECYGKESSSFAEKTLSGQSVHLETDETQDYHDKYGRTLANVLIGTDLYQTLAIQEWYGFRYVYNNSPTKYDDSLKSAEETAKKNSVGVWKYCDGKRQPIKIITSIESESIPESIVPESQFSCKVKKSYCKNMTSSEEAQFYLQKCGVKSLDRDLDGVACEFK